MPPPAVPVLTMVVPGTMLVPRMTMPICTVPDCISDTINCVPLIAPVNVAELLLANDPVGATNTGILLPVTVSSNVRSLIRSSTKALLTKFSV